ncbi:MAG: hypothetical protein P4K86_08770 [Terracidiphilus sp.]|nr:hypothetical protein [Terracidiphilus sp.]MDR3775757.1 hypothetical protein [Terracidiphilus sp.]
MRLASCLLPATLATGLALLALPTQVFAQQSESDQTVAAAEAPPEAPQPQFLVAAAEPPAPLDERQESSSSQTATTVQPAASQSQQQKAAQQIKEQEKQRVLGILPSFNISYRSDAVSLTAKQKMGLAFRSSTDPVTFGIAFVVAGYHEGMHDNVGFPWGIKGYGERSGAAYLDAFDGGMIGNGILPSLLHQDPRYFRRGYGSTTHRLIYAVGSSFICKHDNTGKWEPNYSNIGGNIASGGISNLYYPSSESGIGQTFTNGFIVTAEGGLGSIFQEFWPDVSRKFLHKDPTNGLDAEVRAKDRAEKEAKKH